MINFAFYKLYYDEDKLTIKKVPNGMMIKFRIIVTVFNEIVI